MRARALLAPLLCGLWPWAAGAGTGVPVAPPAPEGADVAEDARVLAPGRAQADRIYDLMGLPRLVETMRAEGLRMSAQLAKDYLDAPSTPAFHDMAARIYDTERMDRVMRLAFVRRLGEAAPWELDHLVAFYDSPPAQRIVRAELGARRDFLDPEVETEAGRAAEIARVEDPDLYAAVGAYVEAGDLIEMNLGGVLTANYHFYLGLMDGGAYSMTEEEILADVWQQEEAARLDIELWLRAFLTHAYQDVPDAALDDYLALVRSPEGQRLNAALFEAYGVLFNDLYRALGRGVSTLLSGEEL